MQDLKFFEQLRQNNEVALVQIAEKYQKGFVSWAAGLYHFREEEIHDFFIDAILDFNRKVLDGKFKLGKGESIRNYLFTIFKNKLVNEVIKRKNRKGLQENVNTAAENWQTNQEIESDYFDKEKVKAVADCMKELGENCQNLLQLFYFEKMSLKEIAQKLNYKNAQTVKAKRHQCFQKLKKIVMGRFDKNDF